MKKNFKRAGAIVLSTALALSTATTSLPSLSLFNNESVAKAASVTHVTTSPTRVSVHDPSITKSSDGTYYVYGSHTAAAKSTDLVNWTKLSNDLNAGDSTSATNNFVFGNMPENLKKPFKWAGDHDEDASFYNVWAPDVFWNPDYINTDGTKGAYMIYFCTSSTAVRSVIAFGVSQSIEGPFTCVDTLIYSGFTKNKPAFEGSKDTSYTNTNIPDLIKSGQIEKYDTTWSSGDSYNNSYAPNAIDPEIYYDKSGKMWMTYGSWSGGIFTLEIDTATGKAKYPGKTYTRDDGLQVDQYFGTRIAGGKATSGEGPFILYDEKTDYFYLYMSYDWLGVDGGYNMRLFRSKNPDGPFVDAAGNNANMYVSNGKDHNDVGIKVMGTYKFSCLDKYYKAEGHNSAMIDDDGQMYLIYHTRFSDSDDYHEVRVHQQFQNEEGWPVTAPFENKGDKISKTGYAKDDIVGEYEFVNHGKSGVATAKTQSIKLNADGTISGDVTGTWTAKDGTYYMNAVINKVTYSGVFFLQHDESSDCKKVMTFTAIGTNNQSVWGVKKDAYKYTDKEILERAAGNLDADRPVISKTTSDITLPTEGFNSSTITWSSSNADIIANDGKVTRPENDTEVTLTATIKSGNETVTKTYKTTVLASSLIPDYKYDFESVSEKSVANSGKNSAAATLIGNAKVSKDNWYGNVLTIKNTKSNENYLSLPSDLFKNIDESGFTVGMWVKVNSETTDATALFEAKSSKNRNCYPYTALHSSVYADFASLEGTAKGSYQTSFISGRWSHVVYTVSKDGVKTYIDGDLSANQEVSLSEALSDNKLSDIDDVRIGSGIMSYLEDVQNAQFDNIEFYSTALSDKNVKEKYKEESAAYPTLKFNASATTLYAGGNTGKTAKLSVSASPSITKEVTYTSSNPGVAETSNGILTAKKAGTTTVTATITSGDKTKTLTKTFTVKKAYIKFTSKKASLKVKKTAKFKVKGYGVKLSNVKWSSNKPAVLAVNNSGKVIAKKKGKAVITAKMGKYRVTYKVTVK